MSSIHADFDYEIGDAVTPVTQAELDSPPKFIVLERLVIQCHGGTQTMLLCRCAQFNYQGADSAGRIHFTQFEVRPYPTPEEMAERRAAKHLAELDAMEQADERRKERRRQREQREQAAEAAKG